MCSIPSNAFKSPFVLSCWCSHCLLKFFPLILRCPFQCMYNQRGKPQSLLFGNNFGLLLHEKLCKFSPDIKAIFWSHFLISCFNLGPIFRIYGNFSIFPKLVFLSFFFFHFLIFKNKVIKEWFTEIIFDKHIN